MFETLFGAEVPLALKFLLAFVFVMVLIGFIAWLVRRIASKRFGGSSARGRQPRLAVVDAAAVDGRRRLVIIRRDNVEHLLMIGGPTDVVVEQNIVRAMGAPRDKTVEPTAGRGFGLSEGLTRPVPLGEGTAWPLQPQPQPEINVRPQPQPEFNGCAAPSESMQWTWPTPTEPQRPAHSESALNNLAEELSVPPAPPKEPKPERVPQLKPRTAMAASTAMTAPAATPAAPTVTPPAPAPAAPTPSVMPPEPQRAQAGEPDQQLAEMAHRLESALRRPPEPAAAAPAVEPPAKSEPVAPPPHITPTEQKPARVESKPSPPKALYDSLEEEMASLLGRPPGKTG